MIRKAILHFVMMPFLLVVLFSCNVPVKHKNEITKIEFATGGCFGECPYTGIVVDEKLNYKYYGGTYAKRKGYFTGKISQAVWDTLNKKLEHIHYKTLKREYQHSVDDESLELVVYYKNKVKRVNAQSTSLPDSIAKVFYWIFNTHKMVKLNSTRDTTGFKISEEIAPLRMEDVRFPPPILKDK